MTGRRGFTLIEVVVGLAVAAVVVAGAGAALSAVADVGRRSRDATERVVGPAAVRVTLEEWLRGASLLDGLGPFVGRADAASPTDPVLHFCIGDGGPIRPGPRCVSLRVDLDPSTPEEGLLAEVRALRGGTLLLPEIVVLAPDAIDLVARYRVVIEGRRHWVTSWESADTLPEAVRLEIRRTERARIGPATGDGPIADALSLPMVLRLGNHSW